MLYDVFQLLLLLLSLLPWLLVSCESVVSFVTKACRILMIASIKRPNEIKQAIWAVSEYEYRLSAHSTS